MSPRDLAAVVRAEQDEATNRLTWMKWMVEQGHVTDWPRYSARERRERLRLRALLARAPVRAEVGR